jgi:hypothetical protein
LSLRNDKFLIAQIPNNSPDLSSKIMGSAEPTMAISNLVPGRLFWMRAHEDRHLLPMRANGFHQKQMVSRRRFHSIEYEGPVDQIRIDFDYSHACS